MEKFKTWLKKIPDDSTLVFCSICRCSYPFSIGSGGIAFLVQFQSISKKLYFIRLIKLCLLQAAPDRVPGPGPGLAGYPAFFASPAPGPGKSEANSGDGRGFPRRHSPA